MGNTGEKADIRRILSLAGRLLYGTTKRKIAALVGDTFYTPMETVLKDEGLDPACAAELAPGMTVFARRTGDHLPFPLPDALYPLAQEWRAFLADKAALGMAIRLDGRHRLVFLRDEDNPDRRMQGRVLADTFGAAALPSPRAQGQQTVLHELVHCGQPIEQLIDPAQDTAVEGDADFRSIETLAARAPDPEALRQAFYRDRSLNLHFTGGTAHDTILYMDALSRGLSPPGRDEIIAAGQKAKADLLSVPKITRSQHGEDQTILLRVIPTGPSSPLAQRRLELYFRAVMECSVAEANARLADPAVFAPRRG